MEERKAVSKTESTEDKMVFRFRKPYTFENAEYTEVDLSGLEDITANDLISATVRMSKSGNVEAIPEMSLKFACIVASRVTGKPEEFFTGMPGRDAMRFKTIITGFLYGADSEE